MYDTNNIFAKILREEIPCQKIAEGKHFLSFYDISPKAKIHALVIPTGPYINVHDFVTRASVDAQIGFWQGFRETLAILQLDEQGYRLVMNIGVHGRQEVLHMHVHILGGNDTGPMVLK